MVFMHPLHNHMHPGVRPQVHHVSGQKTIGLLQQSDGYGCADAGAGMLQGAPQQRHGPAVNHQRERHHAEAVPEQRGVKGENQVRAWLLPVLQRPEHTLVWSDNPRLLRHPAQPTS